MAIRRRKYLWGLAVLVFLFLCANISAYVHARAVTHFTASGRRTPDPEKLSKWEKFRVLFTGATVPRPTNSRTPKDIGLEFETRMIPSEGTISLEAWVIRRPGPKGWVYLFHGYAASKQQALTAARRFYDLGWSSLLVDFRGSGGSVGCDRTSIGYFEAQDVAATVRWGQSNLGVATPVLYGFSMGGAAILRAVSEMATPSGALIVESVFDRMLSTVEHRFKIIGMPAFPMAHLLVFWGGVQNHFSGFSHNPVDYAAKVRNPVLLMHGERDERVSAAEADAIYQRLAGPKDLRIVPGLGHEITEKISPQPWRDMVGSFLASVTR